jgi:hypothetical protein
MGQTQQPMGSSPLARPYNLQQLGGPAQNPAAQQNLLAQLTGTGPKNPNMPQQNPNLMDQLTAMSTAGKMGAPGGQTPNLMGAIQGMQRKPPPGAPGAGPGGGKGAAPGQQLVKQQAGQLPGAPPPGAPGRGPGQGKAQNQAMKQQIASLPPGIQPR